MPQPMHHESMQPGTSPVKQFARHGELSTACEIQGQGPALLLMHGAEASLQMFAGLAPLLAGSFTVIAYDQRDCGDTTGPGRASNLGELADDALHLLEQLGVQRAHVFGSSFGGRVAQALALRHPRIVERLVLGSTWPVPESIAQLNPDGVARLAVLRAQLPQSAEALAAMFFGEPFLAERPELRTFFSALKPSDERAKRRAAAVASTLAGADLSAIEVPTLLLSGDQDRVVPTSVALSMATTIPDCRTLVLPGVGHATAMQAPERVAAALSDFLLS